MGKKILFGCLAAALLFVVACVILAVVFVPRLYHLARQEITSQMAKETARRDLAQSWKVPAKDAKTDEVFPPSVGGFARTAADDKAILDVFEFDPPGRHAVYTRGDSEIDVFLFHVPTPERQALLRRMKDAYDLHEGGMKVRQDLDYRAYMYLEETQYHVWWQADCVVVVRAKVYENQEGFVTEFLKAHGTDEPDDSAPPAETPAGAGQKK